MSPLVLVADDDSDNRAIMTAALTAAGLRVALAQDGAQAIAEARRQQPDLILMDISMPILDGYAATRRLKADAALAAVPILALSAFAMGGDEDKARAAGCDGYITKPCLPSEVVRRVKETLAGAGRAHAHRNPLS